MSSVITMYIAQLTALSIIIGQIVFFCIVFDWHAFYLINTTCATHFSVYYIFVAIDIVASIIVCLIYIFFCIYKPFSEKRENYTDVFTFLVVLLMGIWSAIYLFGNITCEVAKFYFYIEIFYVVILLLTLILCFISLFIPRNIESKTIV